MKDKLFSEWITKQYLKWQSKIGERRSIQQFADYLGVSQPSLSNWMSGKYIPKDNQNINKLYDKLGPEVFDVLGLERPLFAQPEIEEGVRELALAIQEIPEEYRGETRNVLMDILCQVIKDSKDNQLVPKPERRSEISDDDLKSAVNSIKKLIDHQEDDHENEKTN